MATSAPIKTNRNRKRILIGCAALLGFCVLCYAAVEVWSATPAGKAANTASALTKTARPTSTQTSTSSPTSAITPTEPSTITPQPQRINTLPNIPTSTPTPQPSPTQKPVQPTLDPNAPCACIGPDLNCSDLGRRKKAQACYDYCKSLGFGDIYNLDQDGNGKACEDLP